MLWGLISSKDSHKDLRKKAKKLRQLADEIEAYAEKDEKKEELQVKLYSIGIKKEKPKPVVDTKLFGQNISSYGMPASDAIADYFKGVPEFPMELEGPLATEFWEKHEIKEGTISLIKQEWKRK